MQFDLAGGQQVVGEDAVLALILELCNRCFVLLQFERVLMGLGDLLRLDGGGFRIKDKLVLDRGTVDINRDSRAANNGGNAGEDGQCVFHRCAFPSL